MHHPKLEARPQPVLTAFLKLVLTGHGHKFMYAIRNRPTFQIRSKPNPHGEQYGPRRRVRATNPVARSSPAALFKKRCGPLAAALADSLPKMRSVASARRLRGTAMRFDAERV